MVKYRDDALFMIGFTAVPLAVIGIIEGYGLVFAVFTLVLLASTFGARIEYAKGARR